MLPPLPPRDSSGTATRTIGLWRDSAAVGGPWPSVRVEFRAQHAKMVLAAGWFTARCLRGKEGGCSMMLLSRRQIAAGLFPLLAFAVPLPVAAQQNTSDKYSQDEILTATKGFFGDTSKDLATIIEKVFKDQG